MPDPRRRSGWSANQADEISAQKVSRGEATPNSSNQPLYFMGIDYCAQHWRFCLAVFFRRVFKGIEMNDPSPFQDQKMRLFDCPPYLFLKGDPRYPAIPSLQFGLPK